MSTSARCMSREQEGRGWLPLLGRAPLGSPPQSLPPSDVGRSVARSCILQDLATGSLRFLGPGTCSLSPVVPAPVCRYVPGLPLPLRGRVCRQCSPAPAVASLPRRGRFATAPRSLRSRSAVAPLPRIAFYTVGLFFS